MIAPILYRFDIDIWIIKLILVYFSNIFIKLVIIKIILNFEGNNIMQMILDDNIPLVFLNKSLTFWAFFKFIWLVPY